MSRSAGSSSQENPAGSSQTGGEPVFLLVGKLRRPHGLGGQIVMEVWTDFPERLERGRTVFVGAEYSPMILSSVRTHAPSLLVSFEGIDNPEQAGLLRNQWVYIRSDQVLPLAEGEFYHHQIVGLQVISDAGINLGVVTNVLETGANDVLVVHPEQGQDVLLPYTDEVIVGIDLEGGIINIRLLPGLLP